MPPLAGMGTAQTRPWGKLNDDVDGSPDGDDAARQAGLELQQSASAGDGANIARGGAVTTEYKVYKRRFFGLAQLCLLNIVVSWDVGFQSQTSSDQARRR